MIISASRRTDIPTYYSEWFMNRIKEGFVMVRNPMNAHQISHISLSCDVVDGIVFWTKNPTPMIERLDVLRGYMYYFQFTITGYEKDIEQNVPDKNEVVIPTFKHLSEMLGADRVIWRYDPILLNQKYTPEYHIHAFRKIAESLSNYTKKVTISFIDTDYRNIRNNFDALRLHDFNQEQRRELSNQLAEIACEFGLIIDTCAEKIDLSVFGIDHARCIDDRLFAKLLGCRLNVDKDKTQRLECGCAAGIDIGAYNTCRNGCRYCYANYNQGIVKVNTEKHNPLSPLLLGEVGTEDKINERDVKSCCDRQMHLFDN
ncbi:DUF1848 domain-containing protein [Lachnospiraceae bacterium ZAX-1]